MDDMAAWFVFLGLTFAAGLLWARLLGPRRRAGRARVPVVPGSWHLSLGVATGRLAGRGHGQALAARTPVRLGPQDAAQNILVLGAIGTGKTTAMMQPLLDQLLALHCGGLVFDIKGDFGEAVLTLARRHPDTRLVQIGPGRTRFNVLTDLTPEMASSFLKSAILLSGYGSGDGFWVDSATELLRNTFGVLHALPERYSLEGAYSYLFNPSEREQLDSEILARAPYLEGMALRRLRSYQNYHESVFSGFDEKVAAGIRATVAQVLSPFSHPDLIDAFCRHEPEPLSITQILHPAVVLVDLPLARWGLGAKVVYTLIKLRFFNLMQQRRQYVSEDQGGPMFFLCDEYQEVVSANKDGLSDLNFWDKSRTSGTVGIISMQSVASLYAAVGQRDLADAILQNFRQKLCFRTEDPHTLRLITEITGQVDQPHESETHTRSGAFGGPSQYSYAIQQAPLQRSVAGAQELRALGPREALALLSIAGAAHDDIINATPLYLDAPGQAHPA